MTTATTATYNVTGKAAQNVDVVRAAVEEAGYALAPTA